jgi:hypothetical protein
MARAPGYSSWCWVQEDWRSVTASGARRRGGFRYGNRCGAKGTRARSGKPQLCLPRALIEALIKDHPGVLRSQIRKKERAAKGQRVPWHPTIRALWRDLKPVCKDRRR